MVLIGLFGTRKTGTLTDDMQSKLGRMKGSNDQRRRWAWGVVDCVGPVDMTPCITTELPNYGKYQGKNHSQ